MDSTNLIICLSCSTSLSESFNKAFTLPCKHSFCEKCVKILENINQSVCTQCSFPFKNEQVKPDIFVETLNHILAKNEIELCEICGNVVADRYCTNCTQLMCINCAELHRHMNSSRSHVIISREQLQKGSFNTPEPKCRKHGETMRIFCNSCNISCCTTCFVFEHENHSKLDVGESHVASYHSLECKFKSLEAVLNGDRDCIKYYKFNDKNFREHIQDVKQLVGNRGECLKQQVDNRVTSIFSELDNLADRRHALMESYIEKTLNHIAYVKSVNMYIDRVLKHSSKHAMVVLNRDVHDVDYNLYSDPTPETMHAFLYFDVSIPPIGQIKDYGTIPLQPLIKSIHLSSDTDIYAFNAPIGKLQVYLKNLDANNNSSNAPMLSQTHRDNPNKKIGLNNVLVNAAVGTYLFCPSYSIDCTSLNDWFNYDSLHIALAPDGPCFLLALPESLIIKKVDWFGNLFDVAILAISAKHVDCGAFVAIVTSVDKIYEIGYNGVIIKEYAYPVCLQLVDIRCVKLINTEVTGFIIVNKADYNLHFFDATLVNSLCNKFMQNDGNKSGEIVLACDGVETIFILEKLAEILSIFVLEKNAFRIIEQTYIKGAKHVTCCPSKKLLFVLVENDNMSSIQTHLY